MLGIGGHASVSFGLFVYLFVCSSFCFCFVFDSFFLCFLLLLFCFLLLAGRERGRIDIVYLSNTIKGHNFSFLYPVSNFSNFKHRTHLEVYVLQLTEKIAGRTIRDERLCPEMYMFLRHKV